MNTLSGSNTVEELYRYLDSLSAMELELLLLHCYYSAYAKMPKDSHSQKMYQRKFAQYQNVLKSFNKDTQKVTQDAYQKFHNRVTDLYGMVYDYAHKSSKYKSLLMVI